MITGLGRLMVVEGDTAVGAGGVAGVGWIVAGADVAVLMAGVVIVCVGGSAGSESDALEQAARSNMARATVSSESFVIDGRLAQGGLRLANDNDVPDNDVSREKPTS
jgi:hypothetical protein